MHKVPVGPTTVLGGGVTLASLAAAVVAFALGARDEGTIGPLVIGGVSLVTTLVGRYAQAVAATKTGMRPATWGTGSPLGETSPPRRSRKKD